MIGLFLGHVGSCFGSCLCVMGGENAENMQVPKATKTGA